MDTAEKTVMKSLKGEDVAKTKEVTEELRSQNFPDQEIEEAITALEKEGYLSRSEPMGQECLILTRKGKEFLEEASGL